MRQYTPNLKDFGELYDRNYTEAEFVRPGFRLGTVGSLVAAGGTGKTYYALQVGLDIACGLSMTRGGVLYLPAEDPEEEVGQRVQTIANAWKLTDEQHAHCKNNFKVWPLIGESPDLMEIDEQTEKRPLVDAIVDIAAKNFTNGDRLRLVIFDTLRRFTFADENDSGAMSKFLASMEGICKRTGAACYFLHHASKSAVLNGKTQEQQAARGSSVLSDNIRYQEFLSPMDEATATEYGEIGEDGRPPIGVIGEENRRQYVMWGVSKQNYGRPVPTQWYKRDENGVMEAISIEKYRPPKKGMRI